MKEHIEKKKIKYIRKIKPKDAINIYDKISLLEDKINQIVKKLNQD